ncbi:MAG TPA: class F sortase [Thermoleophilaceae bacterium]
MPLDIWGLVAALVAICAVVLVVRSHGGDNEPPVGRTLPPTSESLRLAPPVAASEDAGGKGQPTRAAHAVAAVQEPRPTRIRIAAIGVDARVTRLGLNPDGTMQTPTDYADTGWYAPGPEPGERGAAVIAGHVDSKSGAAVFYRLGELRRGDAVRITVAGGRVIRFRVTGLERWPKASFPTKRVFGRTRAATLRLITCGGAFNSATGHYVDNTIVYGVRETAGRN